MWRTEGYFESVDVISGNDLNRHILWECVTESFVLRRSLQTPASPTSVQLASDCHEKELFREALALSLYPMILRGATHNVATAVYEPRVESSFVEVTLHNLAGVQWHLRVQRFGEDFLAAYRAHKHAARGERFHITVTSSSGPLHGLGALLAAAALLDDQDPLRGAGFVQDSASGIFTCHKTEARAAFGFMCNSGVGSSHLPPGGTLHFCDLTHPDQEEFINTLQRATENLRDEKLQQLWLEVVRGVDDIDAVSSFRLIGRVTSALHQCLSSLVASYVSHLRVTPVQDDVVTRDQLCASLDETLAMLRSQIVPYSRSYQPHCATFQLPAYPKMIGRQTELDTLHRQFAREGQSVILIAGTGGIGKTTLAAAFAKMAAARDIGIPAQPRYEYVAWLRAECETDLGQQYMDLAKTWCRGARGAASPEVARSIVWEYLAKSNRPSLVVLDNVCDLERVNNLLPKIHVRSSIHVIVTTRDVMPFWEERSLHLTELSRDETAAFIRAHPDYASSNDSSIHSLHVATCGLPLALTQAIAYARTTGCSLHDIARQITAGLTDNHHEEFHPRTVGTLVTLALARLEIHSNDAAAVLFAAALLPPDALWRSELMGSADCSSQAIDIAIQELQALGLISTTNCNKGALQMHHLVQQCVRYYLQSIGAFEHVLTRALNYFKALPGYERSLSYACLSRLRSSVTVQDEALTDEPGHAVPVEAQRPISEQVLHSFLIDEAYARGDTELFTRLQNTRKKTSVLLDTMCLGNEQLVLYLLRKGCGVNQRDSNGRTAWHYAVLYMTPGILLQLRRYNVPGCDQEDNTGMSPVRLAVEHGNTDMIQALVFAGADPYRYSVKLGCSTIDYCEKYGDHTALAVLSTVSPRQQYYPLQLPPGLAMAKMTPFDVLIHAIFGHDYVNVRRMLTKYPELCTFVHETKGTLLMYGAQCGNVKVVEALIENGCSPHLAADDGVTTYHIVASNIRNGDEILDCLLRHSTYVALIDRKGRTAVDWANISRNAYAYRRLTAALQPRCMMAALEAQQMTERLDAALKSCVQEAADLTEANLIDEQPCSQLMRRGPLELMVRQPPRAKWAPKAVVLVDATLNDSRDTVFVHRLVLVQFERTDSWDQKLAQQEIQIVCLLRGNTYLCDEAYLNCEGLEQLTLWCKDQFNRHTVAAITSGIDSFKPRSQRATTENRSNLVIIGPGNIKIYTICIDGDSPKEYLLECSAAPAMIESQEVQLRDECSNDLHLRALSLWEALNTDCLKKTACVPVESNAYSNLTKTNGKKIEANDTSTQREDAHQHPLSEDIPLIGVIEVHGGIQDEPDNKVPVTNLSALGGARESLIPDVESTTGMLHADQCKTLFPPAHDDAGEPEFKLALLANCMARICFCSFESGRQIMGTIPVCLQPHERVKLLQRVLRILERSCGTEHPCVAAMVIALAQAWANDQ